MSAHLEALDVDDLNALGAVVNALAQVVEALADRVWAIEEYLGLDGDLPPYMVDVAGPDTYRGERP